MNYFDAALSQQPFKHNLTKPRWVSSLAGRENGISQVNLWGCFVDLTHNQKQEAVK
jgi:hypothetical protein